MGGIKMYFVGIDWADQHHDVVVIDQTGENIKKFRVSHSSKGFQSLKEKLLKLNTDFEQFACMIETRNGLLVQFLLETGFPVYPLNPKVVSRRRKPSGAKSDLIDALLLADIGRADLRHLRRLKRDSELIEQLKVLTRYQDSLIQDAARLKNKIIACLKEYYPAALKFFNKPTGPVALKFLKQYPNHFAVQNASANKIEKFLKEHKHPRPKQAAITIWEQTNLPQLKASMPVILAKTRLLKALIAQLEPLFEQIDGYDKEIEKLFNKHSDSKIFASLPGAGERLAPRLLAEWGDNRQRYQNAAVVQALAGTSPVLYQSGKYLFTRVRRSCIKPFRRALHLFALQTILRVPWAREYYYQKRAQGKKHHETLRALANIWVRIIFAMWQNHTVYDESTFTDAKAKHAA